MSDIANGLLITSDVQELIRAIDEGIELASGFSTDFDSARLELAEARTLAMRSGLNLVILGGEGHGKSTLINAILGTSIVPMSQFDPGTVAPILLEWAPSETPSYQVVVSAQVDGLQNGNPELSDGWADGRSHPRGSDGPDLVLQCDSSEIFGAYLLQRHNRENWKCVRRGIIRLDHALLRQGLRLIDMPGVAGVSSRVAEEAVAFVRDDVYAAIALVRNREYAPLVRLLELLPRDKLRIEAIICNRDGDFWDEFPDEAMLRDRILEQREVLATALASDGIATDPRNTYVLHLPSMSNLVPTKRRGPTGESHHQEIRRFAAWLDRYMGRSRLQTRNAAVSAADRVITRLINSNDEHERLAMGVQEGREDALEWARSLYADGSAYVRERWRQAKSDPTLSSWKDARWIELSERIVEARSTIASAICTARSRVRYSARFSLVDAQALNRELEKTWNDACQAIRQLHGIQVAAFMEMLNETVGGIMVDSRRIFPLLRGRLGWKRVIYQMLMQVGPGDTGSNGIGETLFRRRIGNRILTHYESQLARIDAVPNGSQATLFRNGFELVEQEFATQIEQWLGGHRKRIIKLGQKRGWIATIAMWLANIRDKILGWGLYGDIRAVLNETQYRGNRLREVQFRLKQSDL